MRQTIIVPASKTPTTVTIDIADPIVQITQTGGTPIPVDPPPIDPVPVPTPINIVVPATDVKEHPGSGMEQWHDRNDVTGTGSEKGDIYIRSWIPAKDFYPDTNTDRLVLPGSFLDNLKTVKSRGSKLSFGIMTMYDDLGDIIPAFILNKVQKKRLSGFNAWIPNVNDPIYLAWVLKMNIDVNAAINAAGYHDQIGCIDIRHYGNWGEWHMGGVVGDWEQGKIEVIRDLGNFHITAASAIAIIDAYIKAYPDQQLVAMIAAHDRQFFGNTWMDPLVSDYLLKPTTANLRGRIGIRRDHVGKGEEYMVKYMSQPGVKDLWKVAPITGEPGGTGWSVDKIYSEVATYHHNSVGNGNGTANNAAEVKRASSIMGFHVKINSGTIIGTDTALHVVLSITSDGLVPAYEWKLAYDFGDKGIVYSAFALRTLIGTGIIDGALTPPAGWTTLTLRLVCAGRPSLLNLKVR